MEVLRDIDSCPRPGEGTAVTIGAFDGVHRGHRAVIAALQARARDEGLGTAVVTFDRHPAAVVRPESAPLLLTDLDQKLELLADCGVDYTLVVPFDAERAQEPAEHFVEQVLVERLGTRLVAVGEDFHFGHGRSGDVALLRRMGAEHGFEVIGFELVDADGRPAPDGSVSLHPDPQGPPRRRPRRGQRDARSAPRGARHRRPHGDKRARELGFRTANVAVPETTCLPADGIYAGRYVTPDGVSHASAISLGKRPTFYERAATSLLEAHLLDFDGDLYGQPARVQFVERLRDELKFDSVEALVEQMARDVERSRTILG